MRRPQAGFSLIEVLVAVFILSIILSAIYTSFFVIHDAISYTRGTVVKLQEARTTIDIMRRELEAAMYSRLGPSSVSAHDFELVDRDYYGKPASILSFDTHLSPLPGGARVRYFIRESEEEEGSEGEVKLVLIKRIALPRSDLDLASTDIEDIEAVEDVVSFQVEVLGSDRKLLSTWNKPGLIPEEFRVTLTVRVHGAEVPLRFTTSPYSGRALR